MCASLGLGKLNSFSMKSFCAAFRGQFRKRFVMQNSNLMEKQFAVINSLSFRPPQFVYTYKDWTTQLVCHVKISVAISFLQCIHLTNSLGPSDAIWRWRSWSTLVQVMTCCLTAPSHYLNQCWLIISKFLWHSSEDIILRRFEDTNQ